MATAAQPMSPSTPPQLSLPSAQRRRDGTPRFTLAIPMASLVEVGAVAQFEAELAGGGVDAEVRLFLDDELRAGDVFVDVGTGWGVHAFGAATAPAGGARVICAVADEVAAALLRANAERNALADVRIAVVERLADTPVDELVSGADPEGAGRVFVRIGDADDLPGVLARCSRTLAEGRLAALIWPDRRDEATRAAAPADEVMLRGLGSFGYQHFGVARGAGEPELVPLEAAPEARFVFSLAPWQLAIAEPDAAPDVIRPASRHGWFGDRFVVLSCAPLEYANGQDLLIAAFREFHARHPDALLLAVWPDAGPDGLAGFARSTHVRGLPVPDRYGDLDLRPWLVENGLAEDSFIELGTLSEARMAEFLREADVAVSPARADGAAGEITPAEIVAALEQAYASRTERRPGPYSRLA
jgi:glycosyltransferase involved in cell wall biosynthesis